MTPIEFETLEHVEKVLTAAATRAHAAGQDDEVVRGWRRFPLGPKARATAEMASAR